MGQAGKPNVRRPFQADLLWESRNVQTRKKKMPFAGFAKGIRKDASKFRGLVTRIALALGRHLLGVLFHLNLVQSGRGIFLQLDHFVFSTATTAGQRETAKGKQSNDCERSQFLHV